MGKKFGIKEICYCHTPPRWLYGFETSINLQKYWPVKIYALIVGHFLRMYDFKQAQNVDVFLANSENVRKRILKYYKKDSIVVYPPVNLQILSKESKKKDYYLMVGRIVGGKGLELAIEAAKKYKFNLVISGERAGWKNYLEVKDQNIKFVGRTSNEERNKLMAEANAFLVLASNEDFGITPVEAQMCGTPVIAFNGGGYKETVIDGKTGVLFDEYSAAGLYKAMDRFNKLKFDRKVIIKNALRFSDKVFEKQIRDYAGVA